MTPDDYNELIQNYNSHNIEKGNCTKCSIPSYRAYYFSCEERIMNKVLSTENKNEPEQEVGIGIINTNGLKKLIKSSRE